MRIHSLPSRMSVLAFIVVSISLVSTLPIENGTATSLCLGEALNVAPSFSMGDNLFAIKTGDFNGDGNPDFATANHTSQDVTVRLGTGTGTFGPVANYAVGRAISLATGDFNSDGVLDLVVGIENPAPPYTLKMLLGDGTGAFGSPFTVAMVGSFAPTEMVATDLNGDGNMDLAVAHLDITLFIGNGAGAFVNQVTLPSGFPPNFGRLSSVQVGDINGDGNMDVAAAGVRSTNDTGVFKTFLADGNGSFINGFTVDFPFPSASMASGDFNSDGHIDFAVTEPRSNVLRVLLGNGEGAFDVSDSPGNMESWGFIVVQDFNRDGKLDLAVSSHSIQILLGDGTGRFIFSSAYAVGESFQIASADFNRDNKQDLIVACGAGLPTKDPAVLLIGDGFGEFAGPLLFPIDADVTFTTTAVSDFNLDGKDDAAVGSTDGVVVLLGDGTGKLGSPMTTAIVPAPSFSTSSIGIGDFNSDGKPDLAVAQESIKVALGDGSGSFGPATVFTTDSEPSSIRVADLNNDSHLDLAVANRGSDNVSVLLGDGSGGFAPPTNYVTGSAPTSVTSGDFNGDSKADLAVANDFSNNVTLLLGDGTGMFGPAMNFFVGFSPRSVAAGDFNRDGRSDLAIAVSNSGRVQVFLGTANGSLQSIAGFNIFGPTQIVAKDTNQDGKLDLVVGTVFDTLAIFEGQGTGQFSSPTTYPLNSPSFDTGDFNGDGKIDLSLPVFGGVALLLNTCITDFNPPVVACTVPDGNWHSADVSILCSAQDEGVGLANPSDSNFALTTNLADGTEISNTFTSSRTICDALGNCRTVGPIAGNKIDKKPPSITIVRPATETYLINQILVANYQCEDGGSGVQNCFGPVVSGNSFDTSSVGARVFTVTASDNVGNIASPQTIQYVVSYSVVALYDQTKTHKSGSTVSIKVRLIDANGVNVSSLPVLLNVSNVIQVATNSVMPNDGSDFQYDQVVGGYVLNLRTRGYGAGTYAVRFAASNDPIVHSVLFDIR